MFGLLISAKMMWSHSSQFSLTTNKVKVLGIVQPISTGKPWRVDSLGTLGFEKWHKDECPVAHIHWAGTYENFQLRTAKSRDEKSSKKSLFLLGQRVGKGCPNQQQTLLAILGLLRSEHQCKNHTHLLAVSAELSEEVSFHPKTVANENKCSCC